MAKANIDEPSKRERLTSLESRMRFSESVQNQTVKLGQKLENQVKALEEAICPRVAARLTALERFVGLAKPQGPAVMPIPPKEEHGNTNALDKLAADLGLTRGGAGRPTNNPDTKRPPCTSTQVDAVARLVNRILGRKPWQDYTPGERKVMREEAHAIIHAVFQAFDEH